MKTTLERINEKQARNCKLQTAMNAQHYLSGNAKQTRQEIMSIAEDDHKKYPQYAGHWDEYELVRITTNVTTNHFPAFKKGDVTIAKSNYTISGGPDWTVYSIRNGRDTRLSYGVRSIGDIK